MKNLSNAFKWVGWLAFAASLICGIVFAGKAESGAVLVFIYWAIGGGLFLMFAIAQSFLLDVAAKVNEKMKTSERQNLISTRIPLTQTPAPQKETAQSNPVGDTVKPQSVEENDGYIVCQRCWQRQRANRTSCYNCGAELNTTNGGN